MSLIQSERRWTLSHLEVLRRSFHVGLNCGGFAGPNAARCAERHDERECACVLWRLGAGKMGTFEVRTHLLLASIILVEIQFEYLVIHSHLVFDSKNHINET